jgi:predicted phage tail protein
MLPSVREFAAARDEFTVKFSIVAALTEVTVVAFAPKDNVTASLWPEPALETVIAPTVRTVDVDEAGEKEIVTGVLVVVVLVAASVMALAYASSTSDKLIVEIPVTSPAPDVFVEKSIAALVVGRNVKPPV